MFRTARATGFVFVCLALLTIQISKADDSDKAKLESLWRKLQERRSSLDNLSIALRFSFWEPGTRTWSESQQSLLYIKNGPKTRWESTTHSVQDGKQITVKTINIDDGKEFWSHEIHSEFEVSTIRQASGITLPPAITWLGMLHPHPTTTFQESKNTWINGALYDAHEKTFSSNDANGRVIIDVKYSQAFGQFEFSTEEDYLAEILSSRIESVKFKIINEIRVQPKVWVVDGERVIFPASITNTNFEDMRQTGGIQVEVLSVEPAPSDESLFTVASLKLPVGKQVNDLAKETVGYWDGTSVQYPYEDLSSSRKHQKRNLAIIGSILILIGLLLYMKNILRDTR